MRKTVRKEELEGRALVHAGTRFNLKMGGTGKNLKPFWNQKKFYSLQDPKYYY
jgi:hypothetical protein